MIRLTIGITIYNRRKTLERMIQSLFASNLDVDGVECSVRVFDDCSKEYDEREVRSFFPIPIDYHRHDTNHGADYNMGYMYRTFIETGDDVLFNCDSDLIFDKNWLSVAKEYLPLTDGVLSLFNTKHHKTVENGKKLCIKETVGNAGTVMTRNSVEFICGSIEESASYTLLDHNWCRLFNRQGKKVYCTSRSFVQHIGFDGFNSSHGIMDIGDRFCVDSIVNGQILGDVLHDIVSFDKKTELDKRAIYYLFPFDRIPSGKRLVIYGAGVVGQDYRKQAELCKYCSNLIQVDKNYKQYTDVNSPKLLRDIECDLVLVAAHFASVREEMKLDILELNPLLESKIVSDVCYSIRI